MLEMNGFTLPQSLEDLVSPAHTALIIYDMQVGIVRQLKDGSEIARQVRVLLDAARQAGIRTFFTRHMSLPQKLMGAFQYRMAMAWQHIDNPEKVQSWFLRDSPAFQIIPELQPSTDEAVFDKLAMSAFEGTPLAFALNDCGIRSFLIAGIALEIGIDPTCRHGADLGFVPILVQDACGAGSPEAAAHSLAGLAHMGDTQIVDMATVMRLLKEQP
ncbi:MAG TPA: cysteine hydrolase [Terriglobales bacterium]|nr:cysteine hydrolase [Terriglobales bacterium]